MTSPILPDIKAPRSVLDGAEAMSNYGRIYLTDYPDMEWRLFTMTHEVAHLAAFSVLTMKLGNRPDGTIPLKSWPTNAVRQPACCRRWAYRPTRLSLPLAN